MPFGYDYNLNIPRYYAQNPTFRANEDAVVNSNSVLAKPIEKVSNIIENSVDTFVPAAEEKKKKSDKTAITVASSVLVLSTLVAVLNPRYSAKLTKKLSEWQSKAHSKINTKKTDFVTNKFYKTIAKGLGWGLKGLEFSNNFNSAKDIIFKEFCTGSKEFSKIKDKKTRKFFVKANEKFVQFMRKPYNAITNWFDKISKNTVKLKYKKAEKQMDFYEELVLKYKDKLSAEEQRVLQSKLDEAKKLREFFSEKNLAERFVEQEKSMSELETLFWKRYKNYQKGFSNRWKNKGDHIGKNMTFWAEEIMMPTRNKYEQQGLNVVEQLVGDNKNKKGIYDEIFEIIEPKLAKEDSTVKIALQSANKKLRKANHSECVEYFDKKRDLVLGSAPTDMVTALAGIGLSGVAIGTADNKDERISRALTGAFPVIAGLGASMAFTAMLFSGVQGMLYGALTSILLSKMGSMASHHIVGDKKPTQNLVANQNQPTNNQLSINPFSTENMEKKYA